MPRTMRCRFCQQKGEQRRTPTARLVARNCRTLGRQQAAVTDQQSQNRHNDQIENSYGCRWSEKQAKQGRFWSVCEGCSAIQKHEEARGERKARPNLYLVRSLSRRLRRNHLNDQAFQRASSFKSEVIYWPGARRLCLQLGIALDFR